MHEMNLKYKDTERQSKWRKIYHANVSQYGYTNIRQSAHWDMELSTDKEGHFKTINNNHHKCVWISIRVLKYMIQKLAELKGELEKSTVIFGDFNTLVSIIDRITRQIIEQI